MHRSAPCQAVVLSHRSSSSVVKPSRANRPANRPGLSLRFTITSPPLIDVAALAAAGRVGNPGKMPRPTVRSNRSVSGETDVFWGSVNIPVARGPRHAAARPGLSSRDRCQCARHSGAAARCADGSPAVGQCGHRSDHAADDDLRPHAAGIQHLPFAYCWPPRSSASCSTWPRRD